MKKMLKAFSGIAVALLLVVGLCMTAFAADSPENQGPTSNNPAFVCTPLIGGITEADARAIIGKLDGTVTVQNFDMYTTDGTGAQVAFTAQGAPEGAILYVAHYVSGGWILEKGEQIGNTTSVWFSHFSPVSLITYVPAINPAPQPTPQPTPAPTPAPGGKTTPAQSPKTGEVDYILFAALAAVLVGGVVAGVAVRKNKA